MRNIPTVAATGYRTQKVFDARLKGMVDTNALRTDATVFILVTAQTPLSLSFFLSTLLPCSLTPIGPCVSLLGDFPVEFLCPLGFLQSEEYFSNVLGAISTEAAEHQYRVSACILLSA